MPKVFVEYLETSNLYTCARCHTHLTSLSQLVSKAFRGAHGTAYLFNQVINIIQGKPERKRMTTGVHIVCDIYCCHCGLQEPLGWKYIAAEQQDQKYKEGRFILEEALIDKDDWLAD